MPIIVRVGAGERHIMRIVSTCLSSSLLFTLSVIGNIAVSEKCKNYTLNRKKNFHFGNINQVFSFQHSDRQTDTHTHTDTRNI